MSLVTLQRRGPRAAVPDECATMRGPAPGEAERLEEDDQREAACHLGM